jgi:predicted acyltransferase
MVNHSSRLASIDVLRGFDLFFLVGMGDVLRAFFTALGYGPETFVQWQLEHHWLGFTAWDIIMPLFLFTSGLSMPFSFGQYSSQGKSKKTLYLKIFKRFALLFLLGWICQGNLLDLQIATFHPYCNTLHAIAFGYLITALIVINLDRFKQQLAVGAGLLLVFWACLSFIPVPGFGSGVFTEEGNFAMYIDQLLLGSFIDGTGMYTWTLSSLGFAVTVLSGYFAGSLLKQAILPVKKLLRLSAVGAALIVGGLLWSLQMPVIKPIWSPSMVLLSSGICYLLLALSYLLTDYLQLKGRWVTGLRILGLNSITAYVTFETLWNFKPSVEYLLHGFEPFTGGFFPALVSLCGFAVLFLLLRFMYRHKIFLKI